MPLPTLPYKRPFFQPTLSQQEIQVGRATCCSGLEVVSSCAACPPGFVWRCPLRIVRLHMHVCVCGIGKLCLPSSRSSKAEGAAPCCRGTLTLLPCVRRRIWLPSSAIQSASAARLLLKPMATARIEGATGALLNAAPVEKALCCGLRDARVHHTVHYPALV